VHLTNDFISSWGCLILRWLRPCKDEKPLKLLRVDTILLFDIIVTADGGDER